MGEQVEYPMTIANLDLLERTGIMTSSGTPGHLLEIHTTQMN
jgi:hypothetical protein